MKYTYRCKGTCSMQINFDIEDNKLYNVSFMGGCDGNAQGVASLVEGMDVDTVVKRLSGIDCAGRGTSCPDQLAKAIIKVKEK